jgi:hypothetical protein
VSPNSRFLRQAIALTLGLSVAYTASPARDREFNSIVAQIESRGGARLSTFPFLGVASLVVRLIRPGGVKGLKLAMFEDQEFASSQEFDDFGTSIRMRLGNEWKQLVAVRSRRTLEQTYAYTREREGELELMIIQLRERKALVLQVKLDTLRSGEPAILSE